jgi:hypothetical protein
MIRVVHPGSQIRMLTSTHPGFRIQGSKRHRIPDPGSGSATLVNVLFKYRVPAYINCIFEIQLGIVTVVFNAYRTPLRQGRYLSFVKSTVLDPDRLEMDTCTPVRSTNSSDIKE